MVVFLCAARARWSARARARSSGTQPDCPQQPQSGRPRPRSPRHRVRRCPSLWVVAVAAPRGAQLALLAGREIRDRVPSGAVIHLVVQRALTNTICETPQSTIVQNGPRIVLRQTSPPFLKSLDREIMSVRVRQGPPVVFGATGRRSLGSCAFGVRLPAHSFGRLKHQAPPSAAETPPTISHPWTPDALALLTPFATVPSNMWVASGTKHMYSHFVREVACCALAGGTTNRAEAPPTAQPVMKTRAIPSERVFMLPA